MFVEFVNQELTRLGLTPIVGGLVIAVAAVIAAWLVQFLGHKGALVLSSWSGLGIRTQLFNIIRRPLWISVLLIGVLLEVQWLAPPHPFDFLVSGSARTILVILWITALGKTLRLVGNRLSSYYPGAAELIYLTENVGIAFIAVLGVLMLLAVWQVNLTPLLASAGLAGIIVALAAKDVLGNFFGGISVFLDRPFKYGDYIILSTGERGKVVDVGLRSTRILTRDDVLISVPNSVVVSTKIVNESAPEWKMRVRVKVSVAYSSDVDQVEEGLLKIAHDNPSVLTDPPPRVRFRAFGEWALDFELLCWIAQPKDKGLVTHELNSAILKEFNRIGIVIPIPQRDVFVHHVTENSTKEDERIL